MTVEMREIDKRQMFFFADLRLTEPPMLLHLLRLPITTMSLRVVSSVFSGINRTPNLHETRHLLRSIFFIKPVYLGRIRRPVLYSIYGDRSRESVGTAADVSLPSLLDDELLCSVSAVRDADEAIGIISDRFRSNRGGIVEIGDCRRIISAALSCGNVDLALRFSMQCDRVSI